MSNESPTSVTYSLISPNGFPLLLTLRDDLMGSLMTKMETLENSLKSKGFTPQVKKAFGEKKPEVVAGKCPECGGDLLEKTTSQGKKFHECRNRRYDWKTKQDTGTCKYIKWLE